MPVAIGAAVAVALGLTGIAATIVGGVVAFAITAAVSVGLGLIAGALQQRTSPLPTPSDGQQEIKQPLTPRTKSYGTVRVAGSVWWHSAIGVTLYKGLAFNQGRIGDIVSYHIDENQVDIDGSDKVTSSPYSANNVYLHHRLGLPSETKYGEILTAFGVDNVRGDGVASILAMIDNPSTAAAFQNTYPGGEPDVRVTIDASVVFDPRDPTQSATNESTWKFSDNPVVCLMDYVTSPDGYGIPRADVDRNIAQWIEQMNVCDELVALQAGGFAKRYRIAGTYRLTDDPRDVVVKFESCCDGRVWVKRDGSIGVTVGKFVEPTVVLGDAHITGYTGLVRGNDPLVAVAGIRGEFMSPDHDYREHEVEPWPTGEQVAELSEDRVAALDLLWVPSNSQARRLEKRAYMRAQAPWRGTIHTDAAGLRALDERYVRVQISELGLDQSFEVNRFEFDPSGPTCTIDVSAIDATIDAWDQNTEEGTVEAQTLSLMGSLTKTNATTINVITEMGAVAGQVALVIGAARAVAPADPAGWLLITKSTGSTPGFGLWARRLDGTEGTITVCGATGNVVAMLWSGLPVLHFRNFQGQLQAGAFSQVMDKWATPFVAMAIFVADSDFDPSAYGVLQSYPAKVEVSDHNFSAHSNNNTVQVKTAIYRSDEVPPDQFISYQNFDAGGNDVLVNFDLAAT